MPSGSQNGISNNPNGQPTKYKSAYNKQAYKLCLLGATDQDLADFFEVHIDTIGDWKNKYPAFKAALAKGKTIADAKVAEKLFSRATGYEFDEVTFEKVSDQVSLKIMNDGEMKTDESYKKKIVTKHIPGDVQAQRYWLNNRRKNDWSEKQQIDHTSKGEKLGTVPMVVIQNPHETDEAAIRHSDEPTAG